VYRLYFIIVVIDSSHKDSYLVSLIWNSLTFARQRVKSLLHLAETFNDISNLFGSLQKMKIPQVQSDIDLEVVNSYTTDLSGIFNIITVDDKSTWVNDHSKQVIRQIRNKIFNFRRN
jgi:23S rRNA C2498 (ribose-2'-O)-methylase RlmM